MNNIIRVDRATVKFFDGLEVDGYRMPNGDFRVGITGASQAIGFSKGWLSQVHSREGEALKALQGLGYIGEVICTRIRLAGGRGSSVVNTISYDDFMCLVRYGATQGNPECFKLLGIKTEKSQPVKPEKIKGIERRLEEKKVQLHLAIKTDGKVEVFCEAGVIDILTNTEIIEVKSAKAWKSAIGQVLVYSDYYPNHLPRIHLFGKCTQRSREIIGHHASRFNVSVSFEENHGLTDV